MSRRMEDRHTRVSELELVTLVQRRERERHISRFMHAVRRACPQGQFGAAGTVIGMHVRVDDMRQAEALGRSEGDVLVDIVRSAVDTLIEGMWDETSRSKGIGMIDAKKMQATRDTVVKYWKLKAEPPVDSIYTNRFVEAAHKSGS